MYPVLELNDKTGAMHRLRWNNDDRGVVPFDGPFSPTEWYEAARKWHSILTRKDVEYWIQLTPGNLLINRDDFISRWRNTNYAREEVIKRIVG
ncbi:salicylate hydroxylase [Apiospora arundinis]